MKRMIRLAAILAAICLLLTATGALADTGVKAIKGDFAARSGNSVFLILPNTESGSSLYTRAANAAGNLTLVDSATEITDVLCVGDAQYYLRYAAGQYQIIRRDSSGLRNMVAFFPATQDQSVNSLSYYGGSLYVLVNKVLTKVDPLTGAAEQVSAHKMREYTIADGFVYFASDDHTTNYDKESFLNKNNADARIKQTEGQLYAMNLENSSELALFEYGVSDIKAHGNYVYFANFQDSYTVASDTSEWLAGYLYRYDVTTNTVEKVFDEYTWAYYPSDSGVVIYQKNLLGILSADGVTTVYAPEDMSKLCSVGNEALIYEYTSKRLSLIPFSGSGAVTLSTGDLIISSDESGNAATAIGSANTQTQTADTQQNTTTTNTQPQITSTNPVGTTSNVKPSPSSKQGLIVLGNKSDAVRALQTRLKELGYLDSVDGYFGKTTENAVKAFQRACGLSADGQVGSKTLEILNSANAPMKGATLYTVPSGTTTNTTTANTTTANTATSNTNTGSTAASGSVKYGDSGSAVRSVQQRLVALGYLEEVDGVFGKQTLWAVRTFQKAAGLSVDGKVGPRTLNKLNSSSAPKYSGDVPEVESNSYIFPYSDRVKLTQSDILALDRDMWAYARNEIYARHGYVFNKAEFASYFTSKGWYKPGGFKTSDLSDIEWYNMELIRDMEERYPD